ncbi:MAG: ROK family transcriptional regulator [Anaerosacchariphilus sp.]
MARLGVNKDYLKKRNRGLVLQLIATGKCTSRIELAREVHLTKTAISAIVNELIEQGYLREAAVTTKAKLGRTPVKLEISPEAPKYIGILFGRGCLEAAICDLNMNIIAYERVEREWSGGQEIMEVAYRLLDRLLEREEKIIAIGVATPGPVDVKKGRIINPGYFHGIQNLDVAEPIQKRYGIPVFLDHDVQSAALVEQLYGNGRGYQDVLVLGIEKGVGSGIMTNGHRYQSNSGYPPEMGHFSINHHGRKCVCGNIGCLEAYIGSDRVQEKIETAFGRKIPYREFCQMEDPEAERIMQELIDDLSCAIISLQNIMNFEIILLGMDSIYWQEKYLKRLEDIINERKFANKKVRTLVKKVKFMEKMPVLGAVCNAVSKTFEGEMLD